jgi:myo-inositol 2-dehydrogenase/D-chiro-inositol 1-dehydrogenase
LTTTPVRIGLVGCGRIAERGWIPAIERVDEARLVAVTDSDSGRAAIVAPRTRAYASAEELFSAEKLDAVVIATPVQSHLENARLAAAAGVPAIVEKPPAPDAASASLLAALEPPPYIGFNRRFSPAFRRVREQVPREGRLELKLSFCHRRASWDARMANDEVLLDVGTHLLDLACWLTGSEISRVRAKALERDRCALELELERGTAALSCASDRVYHERVEVRDAEEALLARARYGGFVRALRTRLAPSREQPLVESLAAELTAYCGAVRGGSAGDLASAADGALVMSAVDAARRSAAEAGTWVDVPPRATPD